MIDLNCHALGEEELAAGLKESRELCARARSEGVEEMIVTLRLAGPAEMIPERQRRFAAQLKLLRAEAGDRIKLGSGYEWTIGPELPAMLGRAALPPTINEGHYLLVGLPALALPEDVEGVVAALIKEGYRPVIAHPECSRAARRAASLIARLVKQGALVQIDALSLTGGYTTEAERFARELIEEGQAHFIATRASLTARRQASLLAACESASRLIGRSAAHALVADNPRAALANEAMVARKVRRPRASAFKAFVRASFHSGHSSG